MNPMQNTPTVIVYRSPIEAWIWESGAWVWLIPAALLLWLVFAVWMFRSHRKAVERMRKPVLQPKWRTRL